MRITLDKINVLLLILVYSLTFFGFYFVLLFLVNAGLGGFTREISVPIRGIIGLSLVCLMVFNAKKTTINSKVGWFFMFAGVYLLRILIDFSNNEFFYLSYGDLLFYFISFSIIPFVVISSFSLKVDHLPIIIKTMIVSGFAFSLSAILLYGHFIGQVSRLSTNTAGEEVISPLALSYCSTLIISIAFIYLIYNKVSPWMKIMCFLAIIFSIVPFFLGASRGALFALFLPFVLILIARNNIKVTLKIFFTSLVVISLLIFLDQLIGSGLVNRFFGTADAIDTGSSSAIRLQIWKASFNQFLNNPIIGDKLRVDNWTGHPHNILIETLQTTGFLGFIPMLILIVSAFMVCFRIFKRNIKYSWIPIIFIQSFMQNMFSGSISSAAWFWTSLAFLFAMDTLIKKQNLLHKLKKQ